MPNKKRLFTRHNSTKFLLYTDGRDEEGNKITENVLIPVTESHTPGNSLIISRIAELYAKPQENKTLEQITQKYDSYQRRKRKSSRSSSTSDTEPNLENILDQMEHISEDEDDEYENVKAKLKNTDIFENLGSSGYSPSNVQIEIEECDFSDESDSFESILGQFSSVSDSDLDDFQHKNTLTSAKQNCPDYIKMLNDGFNKVFEEYCDDRIGPLDDEEILGGLSTEDEQIQNLLRNSTCKVREDAETRIDEELKDILLQYVETEEEEKLVEVSFERPLEFDCESIISTYSNKYNHPTIIREESSKIRKIKIPNNPLQKTLTKSKLKQLDTTKSKLKQLDTVSENDEESDDVSVATTFNIRSKAETPEERRERKRLFKEAKRESRMLKKENKLAFKDEKKRQITQAISAKNNSGMRLI